MSDLNGKVAIITGAKGGLGSIATKTFLDAGAAVVGVSRSIQASDFPHPRFVAMTAELSTREAAWALARFVEARFHRIDILLHLVGGFAGGKTVADTNDAALDRMLELNFRPAFFMAGAVIPLMRQAAAGRIIAIGSRAAVEPQPGISAYSASKAALVSLIRTLALENKDRGITANVILPGTMDTPANRDAMPQADFSKWVDPRQVATLAAWLASDEASQVTGGAIPVYGAEL
jgi:NAD(P)-dependent dehydrogenase (short-subunit alcohol dehydrogenase family)